MDLGPVNTNMMFYDSSRSKSMSCDSSDSHDQIITNIIVPFKPHGGMINSLKCIFFNNLLLCIPPWGLSIISG